MKDDRRKYVIIHLFIENVTREYEMKQQTAMKLGNFLLVSKSWKKIEKYAKVTFTS